MPVPDWMTAPNGPGSDQLVSPAGRVPCDGSSQGHKSIRMARRKLAAPPVPPDCF